MAGPPRPRGRRFRRIAIPAFALASALAGCSTSSSSHPAAGSGSPSAAGSSNAAAIAYARAQVARYGGAPQFIAPGPPFNISKVRGKSIDVRLSTMPLQYGEAVVMRLLDQSGGILSLDQIGMPPALLQSFRNHVHRPHGMVLVTGPTGSGKTTTLYAALNELNKPEAKIITVEDPVEYRLPRINQVQIHTRIGLSFAQVLRSALRQDPDVMMVGEMRDRETAEIGLRAAMTGQPRSCAGVGRG